MGGRQGEQSHQLNIALRRAPPRLRLRGGDRASVGKAATDLLAALPYFGIHGCGSKCLLARFDDMRVASLTSLILLATVSAPLAAPYRIDSRHHQEGRPDAATLVPPDWRLQRDEQRYVSPDGSSWFAPHASSVGSEPIARHMDRIARQEGETVTYFRREPDWIAVSGFKAGRIFYRKAVLACGGKVWHHIEFEYPAALKRRMDPFVNRASYSIDHAETTDCRQPQ